MLRRFVDRRSDKARGGQETTAGDSVWFESRHLDSYRTQLRRRRRQETLLGFESRHLDSYGGGGGRGRP